MVFCFFVVGAFGCAFSASLLESGTVFLGLVAKDGGTDLTTNLLDLGGVGTFFETLSKLLSMSLEETTTFSVGSKSRSIEVFNRADCRLLVVATFGFYVNGLGGNYEAFLVYYLVAVCLTFFSVTRFVASGEIGVFSRIGEDRGINDPIFGGDVVVFIGG